MITPDYPPQNYNNSDGFRQIVVQLRAGAMSVCAIMVGPTAGSHVPNIGILLTRQEPVIDRWTGQ